MTLNPTTVAVRLLGLSLAAAAATAQAQSLSQEQARAAIAPFYQALNAGNDAAALVLKASAPGWVSCGGNEAACGAREAVAQGIAGLHKAVPDLKWEIKDVLVSGNQVTVRGEASGTPAAAFMGVPHGGKSFKLMSIDIHTVRDGKLQHTYHLEDWLGATRQLSAK